MDKLIDKFSSVLGPALPFALGWLLSEKFRAVKIFLREKHGATSSDFVAFTILLVVSVLVLKSGFAKRRS
jgi:hypothetical protein